MGQPEPWRAVPIAADVKRANVMEVSTGHWVLQADIGGVLDADNYDPGKLVGDIDIKLVDLRQALNSSRRALCPHPG